MKKILILLALPFSLFFGSCGPREAQNVAPENDTLVIYVGRDTLLPGEESIQMIPVPDRLIAVSSVLELSEKIRLLADSISACCFNNLPMEILAIDTLPETGVVLRVNLFEFPNYEGPGTMDPYQCWYDYFQGSMGGMNTSIVLRESFLQPDYDGVWIDAVAFYYQGDPIGAWDHLLLEGLLASGK
ncbi:MAG: hypothetical protein RBS53_02480 [Bacteroidales bacterium]|jgi:hypothetical protein|nr:hypothetical protein [Bacteroidales bacterium]